MVLAFIIIRIRVGGFRQDIVMAGFPCHFILTQCIGGHVVIATGTATGIIMVIIVVIITDTEPVMPEDVTIRETYTKVDLQYAHQIVATGFQHSQLTKVHAHRTRQIICTPTETGTFIKEIIMEIGRNKINDLLPDQVPSQIHGQHNVQVRNHLNDQVPSLLSDQVRDHLLVLLTQVISYNAITKTETEERRITIITKETDPRHQGLHQQDRCLRVAEG